MIDSVGLSFHPGLSLRSNVRKIGLSEEAATLDGEVGGIIHHLQAETVVGERFERLDMVATSASMHDWDGYGALPVNEESLSRAYEFLNVLPLSLPTPEIEVDPDGEVSFDWCNDENETFSMSISATGIISFAGLFNTGDVHGLVLFEDEIPQSIVTNIRRLFDR